MTSIIVISQQSLKSVFQNTKFRIWHRNLLLYISVKNCVTTISNTSIVINTQPIYQKNTYIIVITLFDVLIPPGGFVLLFKRSNVERYIYIYLNILDKITNLVHTMKLLTFFHIILKFLLYFIFWYRQLTYCLLWQYKLSTRGIGEVVNV